MKVVKAVGLDEDIIEYLQNQETEYLKINLSHLVNSLLREWMEKQDAKIRK